jgi:iron complex outermembrane receptor protein
MKYLGYVFISLLSIQNIQAQEVKSTKIAKDSNEIKKSLISTDSVHQLKQVVVSSKKPLFEVKIDKTVINVDAASSNAGANVIEVLEKSPGVYVDKDGNISLKGKSSVLVLIDGRPTYLSPADLYNYLRTLPSTAIDQIELMTNPPAKYDAAGNAGLINIKTKKNKTVGLNGSYNGSVGQGVYHRNSNGLNLNYRKNKLNLFSNLSYSNWEGYNSLVALRKYKDQNKNVIAIFDQASYSKNEEKDNLNFKTGFDYSLNKKTNLGIVLSGFSNPESQKNNNISMLKNGSNQTDSIINSENIFSVNWENVSANFYLQHKFDTLGKEINFDIDASNFTSDGYSQLSNQMFNADNSIRYEEQLLGAFPIGIKIASFKTDYTQPLSNKGKFEIGVKSSFVQTTNEANFYTIENDVKISDFNKTNSFDYKENINAGYVNFSKEVNKWGFQLGLRAENTNATGYQKGNELRLDSSFNRTYTNLFPTSYITYKSNEKNEYALNFGRRIDRPSYQDMNPFVFYVDKYTYNKGNPFLQPQLGNNFELAHTYNQFLTTTINYTIVNRIFQQSFIQDGFATIVQTTNIGTKTNFGIASNIQLSAKKILTSNIYLAYTHDNYKGNVAGDPLDLSADMYLISVNNQFKFEKGWTAELSGWYRTKGIEGQIIVNPLSQVNLGVQKQVLKNKGTLKLGIRDLFLTNFPKGVFRFSNTEATFSNQRDSRILSLSFTYRFGKTFNTNSRKTTGAEDEKSRVKVGNN